MLILTMFIASIGITINLATILYLGVCVACGWLLFLSLAWAFTRHLVILRVREGPFIIIIYIAFLDDVAADQNFRLRAGQPVQGCFLFG